MKKVAVIFESSPFDRKGLFNAVHNRIMHLKILSRCEIHAFCVHSHDSAFTRRLRGTPEVEDVEYITIDDIRYRILWYDFSITDHLLVNKLHLPPVFFRRFMDRTGNLLKNYDCVMAHSFTGAILAYETYEKHGVPYFVTWHGSDVHTHPCKNPMILKDTKAVMESAECNFFVSEALKSSSDRITVHARKEVLYNGVSEVFQRYSDGRRAELRKSYGLSENDKVVAFVGSIVAVKNVSALQPVFHEIRAGYDGPLKFWMVGDGKLRHKVEPVMSEDDTLDVRFWGNVRPEDMPSVMNCIDVMILPSLNEGLPLVCAEAIRCGANVVGSDVGGIPEVIGHDYTVPLNEKLVENMAGKVVELLGSRPVQSVPECLDWDSTARKELMLCDLQ